jgi:hypothetical protein
MKAFFDDIPHGLILKLIRRKVAAERFVTMIAVLLKARVRVNEWGTEENDQVLSNYNFSSHIGLLGPRVFGLRLRT